jgi:hypothetical protein
MSKIIERGIWIFPRSSQCWLRHEIRSFSLSVGLAPTRSYGSNCRFSICNFLDKSDNRCYVVKRVNFRLPDSRRFAFLFRLIRLVDWIEDFLLIPSIPLRLYPHHHYRHFYKNNFNRDCDNSNSRNNKGNI